MTQPKAARPVQGASKQKKQLMVLGLLSVVLALVLGSQFAGGEGDADVPVAAAETVSVTPGVEVAGSSSSAPVSVPDNRALTSGGSSAEVKRSPFESFWSSSTPIETTVEDIPAPSVTLNGTMTSGKTPVAVIDGKTRFLGDFVQGWRLVSIGSREIGLESPTKAVVSVQMPLLNVSSRR